MQREGPSYELVYTESLRVESKLFFLDARKNQRGVYLKISERKDSTESRATVVFPSDTIPRLLQYLDRCTLQASQGTLPPFETTSGSKSFRLELGRNERGSFLKVSESGSGPKGYAVLFIPAGGPTNGGWVGFSNAVRNAHAAIIQHAAVSEGALPFLGFLPGVPAMAMAGASGHGFLAPQPLQHQRQQQPQQAQPQQQPQRSQRARASQPQAPPEQLSLPLTVQNGSQVLSFEIGSSQLGPTLIVAETIGRHQSTIVHLPANALNSLQLAINLVQSRLGSGAA